MLKPSQDLGLKTGKLPDGQSITGITGTYTHTYRQFSVSNSSDLHVFGLWGKLENPTERLPGSAGLKPGSVLLGGDSAHPLV